MPRKREKQVVYRRKKKVVVGLLNMKKMLDLAHN